MFIIKSIALGLGVLLTSLAGWLGYQQNLGANVPISVARFETTLASKITTTDTSMTLVTGEDRGGNDLNGRVCFTLDGGKTTEEFVCGTASSTAVTGLTRGISYTNPNATSSSLIFEHRAGSNVKITDYPESAITSRMLNGDDTIPNTISYATDTGSITSGVQIPHKTYVDSVAAAGMADGNWTTLGGFILATTGQFYNGVNTSTATRYLVPSASFFNTTSGAYKGVVSNASGKISQGWLDLTSDFAYSGLMSCATTTITKSLTVQGSSTFSYPPTIPTSTSDTAGAVSKYYVENSLFTWGYATSDNLENSNDAEASTTATTTYLLIKQTVLNAPLSALQIKFDMAVNAATATVYGKVYINGVATGTEWSTDSLAFVTYSQSFGAVNSGDLIQVYAKTNDTVGSYKARIKNLRLYYDKIITSIGGYTLITSSQIHATGAISTTNTY